MCLAMAFISNLSGQPILRDMAHMQVQGDTIKLETLFGVEKTISGKIIEVDFTTSKILLGQHRITDKK